MVRIYNSEFFTLPSGTTNVANKLFCIMKLFAEVTPSGLP